MTKEFELVSDFTPGGDQPTAIAELIKGLEEHERNQVLLGVTGSGKTFTMANVIQHTKRPTLIVAHNKTLAAQLYGEMKSFFPQNSVEYFVSYYDYYQPEAYVPRTGTYIEKQSTINDQIDRMRHSATRALFEREDVIIVSSVSCLYGIGSPEMYSQMVLDLHVGQSIDLKEVIKKIVEIQYKRNDIAFQRGSFRVLGDIFEIFPSHYEDRSWKLSFFGDEIESIYEVDSLTGEKLIKLDNIRIYANSHYVTPRPTLNQAIIQMKKDLTIRINEFEKGGQLVEAQRIRERTLFDIEMIEATGSCPGIENYSRYLSGRAPGEAPPTLFEYLPENALLIVDESHVTVPQIGAMSKGDAVRKGTLSDYGFRLPVCKDNRPLTFEEWDRMRPPTLFISATPGPWELKQTHGVFVEQVIRPTGLVDPICEVRPTEHQIDDLLKECKETIAKGYRILVTTLTKKMSEALTEYMVEAGYKVRYMHSEIDTLERIDIIQGLREGEFDVLVGINLLREGLDIPECGLVAILDADKEGFLRSRTSLVQTIGRAARNADSHVILYADKMTDSMKYALDETDRRRTKQTEFNKLHNITPKSIQKKMKDILEGLRSKDSTPNTTEKIQVKKFDPKLREKLYKQMLDAASNLEFEQAGRIRDEIKKLDEAELAVKL